LTLIEQLGGKDPAPQRFLDAKPDILCELNWLYEKQGDESIANVIARIGQLFHSSGPTRGPPEVARASVAVRSISVR
jgi:hypothetical protein